MKIKLIITAMLAILFSSLKAQDVILGEKNPCPGETYEYIFNGVSCDGNLTWSVNHGTVIQTTSNRIKISWNENFVGNGSWHVRAHFSRQKFDGSCDVSSYHELPIKVNAVSAFNIIGGREIPGGFRGTKTYTAQIINTLFPASSYLWTVFSGGTLTNYTTAVPSFNLNITNDGPKWISVQGKNSTCSKPGTSAQAHIFTTTTFAGPNNLCSEATYTLINPGTITLENASGVATLTALGNNQWKVTRIGQGNGNIILRSTIGSKSYDKNITMGTITTGTIIGQASLQLGESRTFTLNLSDNTDYMWSISYNPNVVMTKNSATSITLSTTGSVPMGWSENIVIRAKAVSNCGTATNDVTKTIKFVNERGPILD